MTLTFTGGVIQTFAATISNVNSIGGGDRTFNWTIPDTRLSTTALAQGADTVSVSFGGTAEASPNFGFTYDTITPGAPSTPGLAAGSDTGSSGTDNVTGTAEIGSTVTILSDGNVVGTGVAIGSSYTIATCALTGGPHSITATATDTAGNLSGLSSPLSVTIDITAPEAPAGLTLVSDSGALGDKPYQSHTNPPKH